MKLLHYDVYFMKVFHYDVCFMKSSKGAGYLFYEEVISL